MLLGGCRSERQRVYDAYCSWPMGLSVSLTMPEEQLREVREAGFDYVEVTLNSLRTKSREECSAALERFRADAERVGLTIWSVHLPFGGPGISPHRTTPSARPSLTGSPGSLRPYNRCNPGK